MPVMDERCAGLDVHQKPGVACVLLPHGPGGWGQEIRPGGTMPVDGLARADGRLACRCTPVARERTGDDGTPVCNLLAGSCEVGLVKAQHVTAVPGRKTEVNESAWLAELVPQGLWRARGIPPVAQRERRDVTRDRRTVLQARVRLRNRGPPRVEDATSKLAAVASEIMGVSGRAILAALRTGQADPQARAELAKGRRRRTRDPWTKARAGRVTPQHRLVLTE